MVPTQGLQRGIRFGVALIGAILLAFASMPSSTAFANTSESRT